MKFSRIAVFLATILVASLVAAQAPGPPPPASGGTLLDPVQVVVNFGANQIINSVPSTDDGTRATPIKVIIEGIGVTPFRPGRKSKDDANLPSCS